MSVYLNYWHYIIFFIFFLVWIGGVVASFKQKDTYHQILMAIFITFTILLFSAFSVVVVDKYTKTASLHKLKNKRLLGIEKTVYTGIVRNDGKYTIGEVTFEIKLVNNGHSTGGSASKSMFEASNGGFLDLFTGANVLYQPQTITKKFVVAKNLKAGKSKAFRVYFDFPPYFKHVSFFTKLSMH